MFSNVNQQNAQQFLEARALILAISHGRFGNHRKVQGELVDQMLKAIDATQPESKATTPQADEIRRAMITASKKLLVSPELEEIATFDRETEKLLASEAVDSSLLKGAYFVPISKVESITLKLESRRAAREVLVDAFCAVYDQRVREAQEPLGAAWDPRNYRRDVRMAFRMEWRWLQMSVPGQLKEIATTVFEQEREKAAKAWAEALADARQLLRENMRELVEHMLERLTPGPDGKPKVFRNTLLGNITSFLDTFASRNITEDAELQEIVGKARKLLVGVEAQDLRDSDSTREYVQQQFAAIQTTLDGMVQLKPQRRITFADDEGSQAA